MAAGPLAPNAFETLPATARGCLDRCLPRTMTGCECSGTPFVEIARQVFVERRFLADVLRDTGCARTCEACLPDLRHFLSARS